MVDKAGTHLRNHRHSVPQGKCGGAEKGNTVKAYPSGAKSVTAPATVSGEVWANSHWEKLEHQQTGKAALT